jgi:hypothetical protein
MATGGGHGDDYPQGFLKAPRAAVGVSAPGWRDSLRRVPAVLRRLEIPELQDPLPPPLPEGRVVNVAGRGEMFVRQAPGPAGSPTVMLLHGWALSADLNWFAGGYEAVGRHGPVVATDIRGHGRGLRSEKPFTLEAAADDVAGLIATLGVGPSVLVGY